MSRDSSCFRHHPSTDTRPIGQWIEIDHVPNPSNNHTTPPVTVIHHRRGDLTTSHSDSDTTISRPPLDLKGTDPSADSFWCGIDTSPLGHWSCVVASRSPHKDTRHLVHAPSHRHAPSFPPLPSSSSSSIPLVLTLRSSIHHHYLGPHHPHSSSSTQSTGRSHTPLAQITTAPL